MLFDLLRALLAAAAVGVVPGWFWGRVLFPSGDRAERLAFSIALSMALVPAVALVPARIFGTGVTLAVAVASALVVLVTGLAVYLRFGAAKGPDGPVVPLPTPLSVPSLALLLPAFGLALGVALGVLPGVRVEQPLTIGRVPDAPVILAVAALVLLAGIIQVFASRREEPEPATADDPAEPRGSSWALARRLLLPAVLLLALFRGYSGPVLNEWPFVRGVDHYSHAVMAHLMMTEGDIYPYLIYPPGFHTMTASVSRLSGLEPLEIFPVLGPALLALPVLSLYALGKRLWGPPAGVAAAFLSVLLGGTYYYYNDAMYPNLVTSQFLMVLALAAMFGLLAAPSWRAGLLFALVGSSVVLYHQVASLYLFLLIALAAGPLSLYLLARRRQAGGTLFASLALLGTLAVAYAWDTYDLGEAVTGLVGGSGESATGDAVGMAVGTQIPYTLSFLVGTMVSQPVAWLGLLGALLLLAGKRTEPRESPGAGYLERGAPRVATYLTLVLWAGLLFAGSRTSLTGFPQRFGRDLGVPVALLAALALVTVVASLWRASRGAGVAAPRPAAVFVASLAVLLAASLVGVRAVQSMESAAKPSVQVTITPEIAAAGEWLQAHNEGGNIIISPHVNQVPSRMMLAMGDYSALQSFDYWQVVNPRDLPPTGPEPLRDVLWIVTHPAGGHTGELLRKHDARFVVLYKNMPDRPTQDYWRLFKGRPDLYRTAFENRDVLIVEPREAAYEGRP